MRNPSEASIDTPPGDAEQLLALRHLAVAWVDAEDAGIGAEDVAHAAVFAALATLVNLYGEEEVARIFKDLRHASFPASSISTAPCSSAGQPLRLSGDSMNRIGRPEAGVTSSPSHITMLPRMMVPTGQPVTVTPS